MMVKSPHPREGKSGRTREDGVGPHAQGEKDEHQSNKEVLPHHFSSEKRNWEGREQVGVRAGRNRQVRSLSLALAHHRLQAASSVQNYLKFNCEASLMTLPLQTVLQP